MREYEGFLRYYGLMVDEEQTKKDVNFLKWIIQDIATRKVEEVAEIGDGKARPTPFGEIQDYDIRPQSHDA